MKLIPCADFQKDYFPSGAAPCQRTIKSWVESKKIRGLIVHPRVYIDIDDVSGRVNGQIDQTETPEAKLKVTVKRAAYRRR